MFKKSISHVSSLRKIENSKNEYVGIILNHKIMTPRPLQGENTDATWWSVLEVTTAPKLLAS
jgi:hypothetical protein